MPVCEYTMKRSSFLKGLLSLAVFGPILNFTKKKRPETVIYHNPYLTDNESWFLKPVSYEIVNDEIKVVSEKI